MTLREEPYFMTLREKPYFMALREEPQSHVSCSLPFAFADLRPPTSDLRPPTSDLRPRRAHDFANLKC